MEVQVKEFTTDALMQEVLENRIKNTARVLKCCAEIEKQAKESGDSRGMGFSYYYEGETYYVLNKNGENVPQNGRGNQLSGRIYAVGADRACL